MSCRSCPLDDLQSLWRNDWLLSKKSCKNLFPQPTLFQKKNAWPLGAWKRCTRTPFRRKRSRWTTEVSQNTIQSPEESCFLPIKAAPGAVATVQHVWLEIGPFYKSFLVENSRFGGFFFFWKAKASSFALVQKASFQVKNWQVKGALSRYSLILRHFVVGKYIGGRASFQAKRAQQVSCLSIIVVYIVLCSKIYATAPERSRDLNDRRTKSARNCPWRSASLFHHELFPNFIGKLGFARVTDWYPDVNRSRTSELVQKISPARACFSLAGVVVSSLLAAIFDRKVSP